MFGGLRREHPFKSVLLALIGASLLVPTAPCAAKRAHRVKPVSEKPTLVLIEKLGHHPELLTPDYLQYILGRPAKRNINGPGNIVYNWKTNIGGIGTQDCELLEIVDSYQRITQATFTVNLPRSKTTIMDVEKQINEDGTVYGAGNVGSDGGGSSSTSLSGGGTSSSTSSGVSSSTSSGVSSGTYNSGPGGASASGSGIGGSSASFPNIGGGSTNSSSNGSGGGPTNSPSNNSNSASTPSPYYISSKKLFDQQCNPCLQYSFVPYTTVLYTQPPNSFHVHKAQIAYLGPPLPPPSQEEMALVAGDMRTRAFAHQTAIDNNVAIPMLYEHLAQNPADAEAHLKLGTAYQQNSNLNSAIAEYQLALRYSNGDSNISNQAYENLQALHVVPTPDDQFDFHNLQFKKHGQGLTQGDVVDSQSRQNLLAQRPSGFSSAPSSQYPQQVPYAQGAGYGYSAGNAAGYQSWNSSGQPTPTTPTAPTGPGTLTMTPSAPNFYNSMRYGSNLFPASTPNPNLEPGF